MVTPKIETRLFLNNEYTNARSGEYLCVTNPFDGSLVTSHVETAGKEDVDLAVSYALSAFTAGPWASFTGAQRAACMNRFADLAENNAAELAYLETISMGRPIATLLGMDIPHMAACYRYYAGWADKIEGESFAADDGVYKIVRHEPLGVCAGIASWNATFLYAAWKIAPALAAGNTFIFKTSEKSPLAMLALAKLFAEAGFPPGVVQFVSGDWKTGALLSSHMQIAKISITGSLAAGLKVQAQAANSNLKEVTLELGGKSPAIVFEDANLDVALGGCSAGFLFNSGQVCAAASRVYVHQTIAPKFVADLRTRFEHLSNGIGTNPTDPTTNLGPVADQQQFDRVLEYIAKGKQTAQLLTGGGRIGTTGYFIQPTIFLDPEPDSSIYKEEIFGPVLVVKTFSAEAEVIALANDTTYGLAACVYTADLNRALRVASKIDSGGISINGPFVPNFQTPFGGFKQSGHGKELGKYGLMEYMKQKTIHINMF
ncbi:putative aldehyde dehydrogenase [Halenospora varia]|nr:putative aldehyde dehydrogenase [Halenospora varia]